MYRFLVVMVAASAKSGSDNCFGGCKEWLYRVVVVTVVVGA